jgi:hypothetical protein
MYVLGAHPRDFDTCDEFNALRCAARGSLRAPLRQSGRNAFFLYPAFRFAQSGINPRPTTSFSAQARAFGNVTGLLPDVPGGTGAY